VKKLLLSLPLVLTTALPGLAYAQTGGVDLKIHVANPSQKEPQTIPVKVYLPKEATPKDIKDDLGDLKLDYDPDTGMYYVHGEVVLEAGQSITKTVHMQDIWVFSEEQLVAFVGRAKERAAKLTEPASAQEATVIVQRVEQKVEAILKRQKETDGKPAERIQAYRQGLAVITTIEQDLDALDKLKEDPLGRREGKGLSKEPDSRIALLAGSEDSPEGGAPLGRSISMTTAWRMIFVILGFLGAMSAVFFLTWHRLLRVTVGREQEAVPLVQGDPSGG
jgi:hypothetical protein